MAITVVGTPVIAGSADTNSITTGSYNTTGASGLIVGVVDLGGGTGIISDSKSNTWAPRTVQSVDVIDLRIFDAMSSPTVGAGHTFTATGTSTFPSLAALAIADSGAFDQQNGATGTNVSALQPGSVTPSEDNCIVVAVVATRNTAGTFSINGGFTIANQIDNDGNHFSLAIAYLIQTSAAAANPQWSWDGGPQDAAAVIATYKSAAVAGAGPTRVFPRVLNAVRRIA